MTKEQAIKWLKDMLKNMDLSMEQYQIALEMAIKALEQEPQTGHWIMHIDDLFPAESTMECSECGEHQPLTIDDNYCPNCGAKMESEE